MGFNEEHHDATDEGRDFQLDERKLAALSVLDSAAGTKWFTEAELDAVLENSSLRPSFALTLDMALDTYGREVKGGTWGDAEVQTARAFDSYITLHPELLVMARRSMQHKAHRFEPFASRPTRCCWCLGRVEQSPHPHEQAEGTDRRAA